MSRPKKPDFSNHAAKLQAIGVKRQFDPLEESIRQFQEEILVPADQIKLIPKNMWERWDGIPQEDGSLRMVMQATKKADIAIRLMPYFYPQLKSSEHREQVDYQISWNIKSFTVNVVVAPSVGKSLDAPKVVKEIEDSNE